MRRTVAVIHHFQLGQRVRAIIRYLELGQDEAQWLALLIVVGILILAAAVVFGLAVRLFTCTGGMTC